MYFKIKDIVPKCTERSEGRLVYEKCACELESCEFVNIDFDGILNTTDDFIFAFLGGFKEDKTAIQRIKYVRIQTYIKTRLKRTTKTILAVH